MERQVTELDFRMPEFRDAKVEDYEWRDDGKLVRKDRWETGIRRIAGRIGFAGGNWEIDEVVEGATKDAQRLEWMIFNSATVCHANDDEFCWVDWYDRADEEKKRTALFDNARDAIDAAMTGAAV